MTDVWVRSPTPFVFQHRKNVVRSAPRRDTALGEETSATAMTPGSAAARRRVRELTATALGLRARFGGMAIGLMSEEDLFLPPASLERAQHNFFRLLLLCSQVSCVAWTRSTKATSTGHHRRRHNTRHRNRWQRRQTTDIMASPGGCGVCWVLCDWRWRRRRRCYCGLRGQARASGDLLSREEMNIN